MKNPNRDSEMDKKLSDFTDRVLSGTSRQPDSNADDELRRLEETILRLKRSLPQTEPDKATLKQLSSRLMARLQQEPKSTVIPFWRRWFGWDRKHRLFHPQAVVATGLMVLAILVVASTLIFPASGSSVTASTLTNSRGAIAVVALAGLALVLVLFHRRK